MLFASKFADRIRLFDTTLRDGEQTPGVSLSPEDKLRIAKALDEFGVDVIEGGFARVSKGDFLALQMMAREGLRAEVCSMSRGVEEDIKAAADCGAQSIHLVLPTSELHLKHKLKKSTGELLQLATECVKYAKKLGLIVELSAEDGSRSDMAFLKEFFSTGLSAGADRLCLCDTVGCLTPERSYEMVSDLKASLKAPLSIHCHDDFGMAVANSVAALKAGADQVHVTVNGLGERAGNAALEEVVMSLLCLSNVKLNVDTAKLYSLSRLVSRLTGVAIPPNKAIVGDNAFAHESGIHTHGVLANPLTYEPISPEIVGVRRRLLVGKHAGLHGVRALLDQMGLHPTQEQLLEIFKRVKDLGDRGKKVSEPDLQAIAETVMGIPPLRPIKLKELTVITGDKITPTASVKLEVFNKVFVESGVGVGPVDAAINAIKKVGAAVAEIELDDYYVKSITGGTDAAVEVALRLRKRDRTATAIGTRSDIVMASVEAFVSGMNFLMANYSDQSGKTTNQT
ncbi:MAG: 2-isopropylmalate synthase [Candidatus Bathyarchaeia archaeon]